MLYKWTQHSRQVGNPLELKAPAKYVELFEMFLLQPRQGMQNCGGFWSQRRTLAGEAEKAHLK